MTTSSTDRRLVVPPLPPNHVSRPRLLHRLGDVGPAVVTSVAAGPGAGKSVLLSEWAEGNEAPTAWLALSPDDDDPRHFWRLMAASLRIAGILDQDLLTPSTSAATLELMEAQFLARPTTPPAYLVLDDAHLLHDPDVLAGLNNLVRAWPHRLHLVLSSRSDPLLPLARYRIAGQLRELRAADLAMTPAEADQLLRAHDVRLGEADVAALLRRTEGWAAGLRLSALRMEGLEHPAEFVAQVSVDQASIADYLVEEVLSHQPPRVRTLLAETSFLPEVSGPLARQVTGLDDAATMLLDLAQHNSFVVPVDEPRTRFRYHAMLAETLRYVLDRRPEASVRELYARAARWYEAEGQAPQAAYWYARAKDRPAAARLLVQGGLVASWIRGDEVVLTGFDTPDVGGDGEDGVPGVTADTALVALVDRVERMPADAALEHLRGWRAGAPEASAQPTTVLDVTELRLARRLGAWDDVLTVADRLRRAAVDEVDGDLAPPAGLVPYLLLVTGAARFWSADLAGAAADLGAAAAEAAGQGAVAVEVEALGLLAYLDTTLARPQHAGSARDRVLSLLATHPGMLPPVSLDLADAVRGFMTGDVAAAGQVMSRVDAVADLEWDAGLAGAATRTRAWFALLRGDLVGARTVLAAGPGTGPAATGLNALEADRVRAHMELAMGRPHAALQLLDRHDSPFATAEFGIERAMAAIALGHPAEAEQHLRPLLGVTEHRTSRYQVVRALLCRAHVHDLENDDAAAVEFCTRAVDVAGDDVVMPFAGYAEVLAGLLGRHPSLAARWPVPIATDPAGDGAWEPATDLTDPLTERERAVLRLLATTMSTAEIAAELFVSVNTVKTHLAAIYRKLEARHRREAVLRAREFELL